MPLSGIKDERVENDDDLHRVRRFLCWDQNDSRVCLTCGLIILSVKLKSFYFVAWKQMALSAKTSLSAPVYTWRDNGVGFNLSCGSQMCQR